MLQRKTHGSIECIDYLWFQCLCSHAIGTLSKNLIHGLKLDPPALPSDTLTSVLVIEFTTWRSYYFDELVLYGFQIRDRPLGLRCYPNPLPITQVI